MWSLVVLHMLRFLRTTTAFAIFILFVYTAKTIW